MLMCMRCYSSVTGNYAAASDLDLDLAAGGLSVCLSVCLGAGKSTLLNTLTGRITAKSGHVTLNGQPIRRQLRRKISYVVQQDVFYPILTLRETLTVSLLTYLLCTGAFIHDLCSVGAYTISRVGQRKLIIFVFVLELLRVIDRLFSADSLLSLAATKDI